MRRAARQDGNHKEIAAAFRELGCSVWDTSKLGMGSPDLVIGRNGINVLVEIKNGKHPPSKRRLTEFEEKFSDSWNGTYVVVEDFADVREVVRRICMECL